MTLLTQDTGKNGVALFLESETPTSFPSPPAQREVGVTCSSVGNRGPLSGFERARPRSHYPVPNRRGRGQHFYDRLRLLNEHKAVAITNYRDCGCEVTSVLRAKVCRIRTATQPFKVIRGRPPLDFARNPRSYSRSTTMEGGRSFLKNAKSLKSRRSPWWRSCSTQDRTDDAPDTSAPLVNQAK